jgi:hypothetical protein
MASLDKDWDQFIDELSITGDVLELACRTPAGRPRPLGDRRRRRPRGCWRSPASASVTCQWSSFRPTCSPVSRRAGTTQCSSPSDSLMCRQPGSPPSGPWSGWPWRQAGERFCLTWRRRQSAPAARRQRAPGDQGSTTRRRSWPPGWPNWAGDPRDEAPGCLSVPLAGSATLAGIPEPVLGQDGARHWRPAAPYPRPAGPAGDCSRTSRTARSCNCWLIFGHAILPDSHRGCPH